MTLATDVNLLSYLAAFHALSVVQLWLKLCKSVQFLAAGVLY
jgi:hypothetical protein